MRWIAAEEATNARVIIAMSEQLQPTVSIGLILARSDEAER